MRRTSTASNGSIMLGRRGLASRRAMHGGEIGKIVTNDLIIVAFVKLIMLLGGEGGGG